MTVPVVNVTVKVFGPDGLAISGAKVTALLSAFDIYENQIIYPVEQSATSDVNGVATLSLFPNMLGERGTFYTFKAKNAAEDKTYWTTTAVVPNAASNLDEISPSHPPLAEDTGVSDFKTIPFLDQTARYESYLKNWNTASRTYSFPDRSGEVQLATVALTPGRVPYVDDVGNLADSPSLLFNAISGVLTAAALTIASGQILAADGSAAAPAYSFSRYPATGLYADATDNNVKFSSFGTYVGRFGATGFRFLATSAQSLAFEATEGVPDIFLFRDAANTLAQRNGTSPQVFNLYNTYTDASNLERAQFRWSSNRFEIVTHAAGTGASRDMLIGPLGASQLLLSTNGASRWSVASSGHLLAQTDNTYDIGASGASRPRDLHIGRNLVVGSTSLFGPQSFTARTFSGLTAQVQLEAALNISAASLSMMQNRNDNLANRLIFGKSRGIAVGAVTLVQSGDSLGEIHFYGADGVDVDSQAARIGADVDGVAAANNMPGRLVFSTTAVGSAVPIEALRINSSQQLLAQDKTAATPAYSFVNNPNSGLYNVGGAIWLTILGADMVRFGSTTTRFGTTLELGASPASPDIILARDAANVLAQRNGVNAQTQRLYNTFTDSLNFERLTTQWNGGTAFIFTEKAGTGLARALSLGTDGLGRWDIQTTGHLFARSDNSYDIGASGANRPRSGYFGTSVLTPVVGSNAAGSLLLTTSGGTQMQIGHIASAVNFVVVTGASTGNSAQVYAAGSDVNVHLALGAKGGNSIRFFTDILGSQAEQFRVAHTASAVNYIQVNGRQTGSGPIIRSSGSDANINLELRTKGTGSFVFITDDNSTSVQQFSVSHAASAVNWLDVRGAATGGNVQFGPLGSDTNIGTNYINKGSGSHNFYTNSGAAALQVRISHTASAVNYVNFTGAPTTQSVTVAAEGSDANVGLILQSKGVENVHFRANGAVQFRVAPTASAVNFAQVTGGATGLPATISAQGETDVGLTVTSKGGGSIILEPNTGDIRWNKALVALGGGAAPTLGTIGGSGPATAAQNSWMRVLDSTGAAFWVPAWK